MTDTTCIACGSDNTVCSGDHCICADCGAVFVAEPTIDLTFEPPPDEATEILYPVSA